MHCGWYTRYDSKSFSHKKKRYYLSNNILGPLLYKDKEAGKTMIIGIVSFGFACASPDKPGYYSRVNQVLPWINDVIRKNSTCPPKDRNPDGKDEHQQNSNIISSYPFSMSQSGLVQTSLPNSSCSTTSWSSMILIVWQIKVLTYDILFFISSIYRHVLF